MLMSLLLMLVAVQSGPATTGPVSVGRVVFEPADLSVSYEQVVPLGTTYYRTQIVWRFSDGTVIEEPIEADWFFETGFAYLSLPVLVNPLSSQTLVPSTPERPARYGRKPKTSPPIGSVLIAADVFVVASILSDGTAFGNQTTVRQAFAKRQALRREYNHWLRVFTDTWSDYSAIATLRSIVPRLREPRPDALGEQARLMIKRAAEAMLQASEQDLSQALRYLKSLIDVIQQHAELLRIQSGL